MSLDVTLTLDGVVVYDANITHNLGPMAKAAGIYMQLWRPGEIGASRASDIVDAVESGLVDMARRPSHFQTYDSPNGWGLYRNFLPWVASYAEALRKFPDAEIEVSR